MAESTASLSAPRRLHPAVIVLMAIRVGKDLAIPILIPLALRLFSAGTDAFGSRTVLSILGALILFLLLSSGFGLLSWRRFTYRVEAGELRIEQGIINRKRRYIPLERVQTVDLSQGILQRLFTIVSVRVETAGGGGREPEVSLPGIARDDAELLRQIISARTASERPEDGPLASPRSGPEIVRTLTVGELLLAGSTAGRVGVALTIVASAFALVDDLFLIEEVADATSRIAGALAIVIFALAIAAFIWLLGVLGTVLAHFGFTLTRDGDNLLISRGLLEKRRATIPLDRIQAVRIVQGIVRQPFGLVELRVESAGFGKQAGESTVLFPLLRRDEIGPFLETMAPAFAHETRLRPLPTRARRRYAGRPQQLIPALLLAGIPAVVFFPEGLVALLVLPLLAIGLGLWQYRDAGWVAHRDVLVVRWRVLGRVTAIVPRRRVQIASASQNPFQRRADLATFGVSIASGSGGTGVEVVHLDLEDSQRLLAWTGQSAVSAGEPSGHGGGSANRDAVGGEVVLRLGDGVGAEVED